MSTAFIMGVIVAAAVGWAALCSYLWLNRDWRLRNMILLLLLPVIVALVWLG